MAKMMIYGWNDQDNSLDETKLGDHFVPDDCTDDEAIQHTVDYIKTQFPRRARHFNSGRVLYKVWDVSKIAKKEKKFYKGSHIDDVIRDQVGRPGTQGKEFHALSFDDLVVRVENYIRKTDQPLATAGLAPWQYEQAEDVIAAINQGHRIILAELCARFGKTIWAGALAVETGVPITIVASYVLTSFSSFAKDLTGFEQFRDIEIVDSASDTYQQDVKSAIKQGRQTVVFLSMCGSTKRQDRIDFLFGLKQNRLVFIDEADFGAHTEKQADPFIEAQGKNDVVVLMTGTNGERACGNWKIDHYLGTTYAELLMEKAGV
jgi:hypothetical protein